MSLTRTLHHPLLEKLGTGILNTFFPLYCLGCDTPGAYLCRVCSSALPLRAKQRCPGCRKAITPRGEICFECSGTIPLDGLFAPALYRSPLISTLIHTYKYRFIPLLADPLGAWLAEQIARANIPLPDCVIPVPLHRRRLHFRGFNQSILLAETIASHIAPHLDIPVLADALVRVRYTRPQIKTDSREERLINLKNAFAINEPFRDSIAGKYIWLIDDVATTGATLTECTIILKQAGATKVFAIVLAR